MNTTQNAVPERWEPKELDIYYYVDEKLEVCSALWGSKIGTDERRRNAFNCFPSREAAQQEAGRRLIDAEFRAYCRACNGSEVVDWRDTTQTKWGVLLVSGLPMVDWSRHHNKYFASCAFVGPNAEANARKALELYGERLQLLITP